MYLYRRRLREILPFPSCCHFKMVSLELSLLILTHFSLLSYSLNASCSNEPKCRCYQSQEDFVADCSNLKVSSFPEFSDNVTVINVSKNDISSFPQEFPSKLRYLDISENNLTSCTASVEIPFLDTLKMDANHVGNGDAMAGLFYNLQSLRFLSIKDNNDHLQLKEENYPKGLFERLVNLNSLYIDGFQTAAIGDLFNATNNLTLLDMSGIKRTCFLPIIRKEMFQKFKEIENLSISYCEIKSIEKGAFEHLIKLVHLDISHNEELTLVVLPNVTFNINAGIKHLNFEKLQCTMGTTRVFRTEYVEHISNTSLETINIASNRIAYLQKEVPKTFPTTLKLINASENFLLPGIYFFYLQEFKGLTTLDVSYQYHQHQRFDEFFQRCNDENNQLPHSQKGRELTYGETDIADVDQTKKSNSLHDCPFALNDKLNLTFYMPPKLKILHLHHTHYTLYVNLSIIANNSQLTHIYANNNFFIESLYPIFGISKLIYLDLSYNLLNNISGMRVNDLYSLRYLDLSFNNLGSSFEDEACAASFSSLHNLETLNLSTNRIIRIASGLFQSLKNIKHLNFSFNKLNEWPIKMNHMKLLTSLDLSYNELKVLSKRNMDDLNSLASANLTITLYGNPLICTCDSVQFWAWLTDLSHMTIRNVDHHKCVLSNGSSVAIGNVSHFVQELRKECTTYLFITLGSSICVLVFLVITTWKIIHRYRWTLRYWYYVSRSAPKRYKSYQHPHFRYDAYMSYDEEDRDVALRLTEMLETKKQKKCCLPERDFMPGTNMFDNVINAVHVSRKVVCIMSENYMISYWPMFEFQIGQMDAMHSSYRKNKKVFIAVLLRRSLRVETMQPAILGVLESDCCIACNSDENILFVCSEKLDNLLQLDM